MGRKSNAPQRKEEITWALYECLAKSGHEKVTVKEIARQANLAPGIIHYYFKSKDEIASTLAETILEKYSSLIAKNIADAKSPEEKIDISIDFIVDNMIFSKPINRVFYNMLQMGYERDELGDLFKKMFGRYRNFLKTMFEELGAGQESDNLATLLITLTEGYSVQVMVDPSTFNRNTVHRMITMTVKDHLARASGI